MNVYPVYEANVMYEYKLVTKVGTTLAPHWLGASDGNTRRWYTACQHWHRSQLRSAVGAVISPGSAENIVIHHSRESWHKVLLLLRCHLHRHIVTQLCCDFISVQNNSGESGGREGESLS